MAWKDAKSGGGGWFLCKGDKDSHTLVVIGEPEVVNSKKFGQKRVLVNAADRDAMKKGRAGVLPMNITTGEDMKKLLNAEDAKNSLVGKVWVTVTRHGLGIDDTIYNLKLGKKLTPAEAKSLKALKLNDLTEIEA